MVLKPLGILMGGFMINTVIKHLPSGILCDAICETGKCLPDAIQLLTPCTIGNGWMKIINVGRFALTLYDKDNYEGVRAFLDMEKVETWPEIKAWYLKLKSKKEQEKGKLIQEIKDAGDLIISLQKVRVQPHIAKRKHKGSIAICSRCHEAYPADDGAICLSCQGETPYV
ncbi:MAG: FmdE, Molybdenum formylmethanofuran dehydrogenase operon [Syntrophorhabdus sp. PtaU1.Bin002]|nr:MAG: FmdE, Molybdenum formylmethanofuran dehydrogenase operon [Syntrophorhabdus sp. PtaU1.Bin002]